MAQDNMVPPKFKRVFHQLRRFTTPQRRTASLFLSEPVNGEEIVALIDQIARQHMHCPRCDGTSFYRHGFANMLQRYRYRYRYRCRDCGRTFNGLSGRPLARLRLKQLWLAYLDCLREPVCTVHNAAGKVGVHPNTSFRW
ncbi:MAG: IS1595 family transposase, partial [Massilia sp.]